MIVEYTFGCAPLIGSARAASTHHLGDIPIWLQHLADRTLISAEDFRTLNQCLDDAIAGAVTEFAKEQDSGRDGELSELWSLVNSGSAAFEALQSGRVGVGGATAAVVRRSFASLRAYVDRREVDAERARAAAADAHVPEGHSKA